MMVGKTSKSNGVVKQKVTYYPGKKGRGKDYLVTTKQCWYEMQSFVGVGKGKVAGNATITPLVRRFLNCEYSYYCTVVLVLLSCKHNI
jgi:hypothetical protein